MTAQDHSQHPPGIAPGPPGAPPSPAPSPPAPRPPAPSPTLGAAVEVGGAQGLGRGLVLSVP